MIQSFGDDRTRKIFNGISDREVNRFPQNLTRRKLDIIEFAEVLEDLMVPPGNRLERLKGSMEGLYSIRINDQWRITFEWHNDGAHKVQIVDYH